MRKKNTFILIILLIIVLIIVVPMLVINIKYLKSLVLLVFKTKENSYQYLQFIGAFLGVVITMAGTFITIDYQLNKEKQLQIQIKLRESLHEKAIIIKKNIISLGGESHSVRWAAEEALSDNERSKEVYNDEFRIRVRDNYNKVTLVYQNNIVDFKIELETLKEKLEAMDYKYEILENKIKIVEDIIMNIGMRICVFPSYTKGMMKKLIEETNELDEYSNELYEELNTLIDKLHKYYKTN